MITLIQYRLLEPHEPLLPGDECNHPLLGWRPSQNAVNNQTQTLGLNYRRKIEPTPEPTPEPTASPEQSTPKPTVSFTAEEWHSFCAIMRKLTWNQPILMTEWKFIQNSVHNRLTKETTK